MRRLQESGISGCFQEWERELERLGKNNVPELLEEIDEDMVTLAAVEATAQATSQRIIMEAAGGMGGGETPNPQESAEPTEEPTEEPEEPVEEEPVEGEGNFEIE